MSRRSSMGFCTRLREREYQGVATGPPLCMTLRHALESFHKGDISWIPGCFQFGKSQNGVFGMSSKYLVSWSSVNPQQHSHCGELSRSTPPPCSDNCRFFCCSTVHFSELIPVKMRETLGLAKGMTQIPFGR